MPIQRFIECPEEKSWSGRQWLGFALLAVSLACFSWSAWIWVDRELSQATAESEFEKLVDAENQAQRSPGKARVGPRKPAEGPVAKLEIKRLGVGGFVHEGMDQRTLQNAIGMSLSGARPGESGNVVLAAHRDTFFAGLRRARSGDLVVLKTTDGQSHKYRISKTFVVEPSENWVMRSSPKRNLLTLITCYPFRYVGSAPQRFIVQADPIEEKAGMMVGRNAVSSRRVGSRRTYN